MNSRWEICAAAMYAIAIPVAGFIYLGPLIASLFAVGYVTALMLWMIVSARPSWSTLRLPYYLTLFAFLVLHKPEERITRFFEVVSKQITGVPVPEVTPLLVASLLVLPIAPWLLAPMLVKRGHALGYFFLATLFCSMGIVELAHFAFPLMTSGPFGYFPGMASVVVLAPLAWWGLLRLSSQ